MLLRSSSTPILSSLLLYSSLESEHIPKLPRTVSFLCLSQNTVEIDLQNSSSPKKRYYIPCSNVLRAKIKESNVPQQNTWMKEKDSMFPSHGLDDGLMDHIEFGGGKKDNGMETSVMGGWMGSNGCKGGGRGSDSGNGRGWSFNEENSNGRDRTNTYYQNIIEANPGDALLLGNYAKFLMKVCGDYPKAEEYLERAILANHEDSYNLSLYADLIWHTKRNFDRAKAYFDQAIKSAPEDCYVMASYASFLWDAEDEEDDRDCQNELDHNHTYPTDLFRLTAAS